MTNRSTSIIGLLLVACLAYGGLRLLRDNDSGAKRGAVENPDLIIDRVWVDADPNKQPDPPTDYLNAFIMLDFMPAGIFQKASGYHLELEVFEFERARDKVRLRFPQRNVTRRFAFEIRACDDLPPFDLCVTLNKNPWSGPTTYYSMREWQTAPKALQTLRTRLSARAAAATRRK